MLEPTEREDTLVTFVMKILKKLEMIFDADGQLDSILPVVVKISSVFFESFMTNMTRASNLSGDQVRHMRCTLNPFQMPKTWKQTFCDAFAQFPNYKIIWKVTQLTDLTDCNVAVSTWVPQRDILRKSRSTIDCSFECLIGLDCNDCVH